MNLGPTLTIASLIADRMEEYGTLIVTLVKDRSYWKYRVNIISKNRIFGWIKPI